MSTYTQIFYQITFSTKNRIPCLTKENRRRLFGHMHKTLQNKKCHLYRLNGVEDHIHIITHLHPTVALSNLVKDLKVSSSIFIKEQNLFPDFQGWQVGYAAFTYSIEAKVNLIEYVKKQEKHHIKWTYKDELISLLKEHNIEFDEKYLL